MFFSPFPPTSAHRFRPIQRILVTGGAGYIGSHTVLSLALTRRFKVVSIDNYHNSFPLALSRIEGIAAAALPPDASPDDIESAKIDTWTADLTSEDQVRAVFAHYGPGAFWGVIHIAVRLSTLFSTRSLTTPSTFHRHTRQSESRMTFLSPTIRSIPAPP